MPINHVTIHFGYRQVLYRNRCSLSKNEQRNSFSDIRINMPLMNGMQAALEIRRISPRTKILFLSVVGAKEAAVGTRLLADGFIAKSDAGKELIPACGKPFTCHQQEGCWCADVRLTSAALDALRARFADCLYEACLRKEEAMESQ